MPHFGTVSVRDYSDEVSTTRLNFGAITVLTLPDILTNWGNWRTALGNIILGVIGKEVLTLDSTTLDNSTPANSAAQVELKFLFTYEGDTSKKKYRFEVPTPDTSKVLPGTDVVDLTDPDIAAFITATETLGRSPDNPAETITVLDARLVGRNI